MKTLIVEDDMMSQCLLAKVLTERGHEVVSYENAEQAILAYQKQFYPLLFVDVGLPGMDGLQFCKWMRAQPNGDNVFIIVATSSGQPDDLGEVLNVGANDYLAKPYDVGALALRLTIAETQMKQFFERKELEQTLRASQESFHRVVRAANEGAWLLDARFRTESANPQMAAILGCTVEELANRAVTDYLSPAARRDAEQVFAQQRDGREVKQELRFRRKDGSECLAFLSAAPLRAPSGEFTGSLWMVADLTGRKSLETELTDTRKKFQAQIRDLTADLNKSSKLLQTESGERKKAEQTLQQLRADWETRLREQTAERAKLAEQLKTEAAGRQKVEGQLARTRDELAARAGEITAELNKAKEALQAESHRRKEGEEALRKLRKELEGQIEQQKDELARGARELKAEQTAKRQAEEALQKARAEVEQHTKHQAGELAKTEKLLQAEIGERKRAAESLQKLQHEGETRLKELTAQLARTGEELKNENAERKRAEQELGKLREELAHRLKEHTAELLKSGHELKSELVERKRVEEELLKTREDFARRVKDHMAEMVKAGDELKAVLAERKNAEQTLGRARDEAQLKVNERTNELAGVREQLKAETAERQRLEQNFARARQELEARIGELSGQLDRAKQESLERAAQVAGVHEELKTRNGALDKASEDLKNEMAARRRAEAHSAALLKLDKDLGAARTPNDAARVIVGVAHELLGWDACSFDLYSAEENRITPILNIDSVNGRPAEVPPTYSGPEPSPIMQRVIKDGAQLVLRSGPSDSHMDYVLFGDRARLSTSLMCVPVRAGNKVVGFLSLHSYGPGDYRQEDRETLQTLADQCGSALERMRAEENQHRSEKRFQLIARVTNDVVWDWNLETDQVWWSDTFRTLFGYQPEEIEPGADSWSKRIHPEDRERVVNALQSLIQGGGDSWSDEYRFRRGDGSYAHVFDRGHVIRSANNKPVGMIRAMTDVSQRKQTEAAMIEGQARKGAILEAALDAIVTIDHEGKVFEWNPAAEKMFGRRRAEILGRDLAELIIPPAYRDKHRAMLSTFSGGEEGRGAMVGKRVELRALRAGGAEFPIEMTITRIATEGPPIFTGFIRDITERLGLEAQLRHAQKMESIGQLAAGVAHDFNNLLSVVQGYSTLLMEEEQNLKPETAEAVRQIASATERATHLTRQLLTFGRKQVIHVRNIDLNELVNNVGRLLRRAIGESVALQFNYSPSLPAVEADAGMMEQVVMNLAINARDAMPQGGQLTIGTKSIDLDEAYVRHNSEARPGRFVCLTVVDTGCGMDEATLDRIFEPFFTTKAAGKGTGLGLATVYGIVKQHEGWIEVQSQVGQGTTFQVFLPATTRTVVTPPQTADRPAVRGGTETILLVEDEPAVLAMARGILQRLGYRVFTAVCGDEAVPIWQQNAKGIDLLLTDMVMPGSLNGRELAEKLLQEKPALKVLYTSGYSMDLLGPGLATSRNFIFLQKPYHPDALAQTVRNCLDGKLP